VEALAGNDEDVESHSQRDRAPEEVFT